MQLNKEDNIKEWIYIHWFEFVMTHLTHKLAWMQDQEKKIPLQYHPLTNEPERIFHRVYAQLNGGDFKQHPVDYLYEQFKLIQ